MTPKEKAEELIRKFNIKDAGGFQQVSNLYIKQCAIIAIGEIICANPHSNPFNTNVYSTIDYWQEVKQEIYKI